MATVPIVKPTPVVKVTAEQLKIKLHELEKQAMTFVGKEGHNPFLWIRHTIRPLESKIHNEGLTQEVIDEVNNLVYKP